MSSLHYDQYSIFDHVMCNLLTNRAVEVILPLAFDPHLRSEAPLGQAMVIPAVGQPSFHDVHYGLVSHRMSCQPLQRHKHCVRSNTEEFLYSIHLNRADLSGLAVDSTLMHSGIAVAIHHWHYSDRVSLQTVGFATMTDSVAGAAVGHGSLLLDLSLYCYRLETRIERPTTSAIGFRILVNCPTYNWISAMMIDYTRQRHQVMWTMMKTINLVMRSVLVCAAIVEMIHRL